MKGMDLRETLEQVFLAARSVPRSWSQASPGERLRALRESRGISQRHLAQESGVDQAVICRMERGGDACLSTWERLFSALGFEVVWMPLYSDEDMEGFLRDGAQERKDMMEAGRMARWGPLG